MRKFFLIFGSIVLVVMLAAVAVLMYLYSDSGNQRLRSYLEQRITRETGLPVRLEPFSFKRGHLYFIARIDANASLGFDGRIDPLRQRIAGRYRLIAHGASYRQYRLRQADIEGTLKGTLAHIEIDGKGTLLDEPAAFRVQIVDQTPKNAMIQVRRLPLNELLQLGGVPPLAQGELNADILIPSLDKENGEGKAIVRLDQAHFDPKVIEREYHYALPEDKTALTGEFRGEVSHGKATFHGQIVSDLVTLYLEHGQANIEDRTLACDLRLDTRELAPLTQNQLHGPMKLEGMFKYTTLGPQLRATTKSLGGNIQIDYTNRVDVQLKQVALKKVLHLAGQPAYAAGAIDGTLTLESPQAKQGTYALKVPKGTLNGTLLNKEFATALPKSVPFALQSRGTFDKGVLQAQADLTSSLLKAQLDKVRYHVDKGSLSAQYRLYVPDPLKLSGQKGNGKAVPVDVAGTIEKGKSLKVTGRAKGLGKKLTFVYGDNRLKIDADDLRLERLLASAGMPPYAAGPIDARIDLKALEPIAGTLKLSSGTLKTNASAMKKLLGSPLDTQLSLTFDGKASKGDLRGKAAFQSPLASIALPGIVYHSKNSALNTPYTLKVPELAKLESLIGTKLKGPLAATGKVYWASGVIDLDGATASLGGKVQYRYKGSTATVHAAGVPLPAIMHLLDQADRFDGTLDGDMRYDTSARSGKVHAEAKAFRFKSGTFTKAVKLVLRKDLTQIIYDRAILDAILKGDRINYTFKAHGKRSDFSIRDGRLDTKSKTNKASFGLRVDNVDVIGTVRGNLKDPKVKVLPGKMLRNRLKNKAADIVKKKLKGNVGSAASGLIKKLPF